MNERIERDFTYHQPTTQSIVKMTNLRARARGLAHYIDEIVPDSREKSLAMTNLEQAVMWVNASIARYKDEEAEELEPKVWATADQKVRCSGCDFEISESTRARYTPCQDGTWVPVTN